MQKPTPIDEEVIVEPRKTITSNTDIKGIIKGNNSYFSEISGYTTAQLKNQNHNIIRHPDMPKIVFKLMWDRILQKKNIYAFVKNLRKDGKYYWVITDFEVLVDKNDKDKIIGFYAYRKAAPRDGIEKISKLYEALIEEEKKGGMEASAKYLEEFLTKNNTTYDKYIDRLLKKKKEGLFSGIKKSLFG